MLNKKVPSILLSPRHAACGVGALAADKEAFPARFRRRAWKRPQAFVSFRDGECFTNSRV